MPLMSSSAILGSEKSRPIGIRFLNNLTSPLLTTQNWTKLIGSRVQGLSLLRFWCSSVPMSLHMESGTSLQSMLAESTSIPTPKLRWPPSIFSDLIRPRSPSASWISFEAYKHMLWFIFTHSTRVLWYCPLVTVPLVSFLCCFLIAQPNCGASLSESTSACLSTT